MNCTPRNAAISAIEFCGHDIIRKTASSISTIPVNINKPIPGYHLLEYAIVILIIPAAKNIKPIKKASVNTPTNGFFKNSYPRKI